MCPRARSCTFPVQALGAQSRLGLWGGCSALSALSHSVCLIQADFSPVLCLSPEDAAGAFPSAPARLQQEAQGVFEARGLSLRSRFSRGPSVPGVPPPQWWSLLRTLPAPQGKRLRLGLSHTLLPFPMDGQCLLLFLQWPERKCKAGGCGIWKGGHLRSLLSLQSSRVGGCAARPADTGSSSACCCSGSPPAPGQPPAPALLGGACLCLLCGMCGHLAASAVQPVQKLYPEHKAF